ncbi:MAG: glycoside hydrolase family 3 protein, partial [Mycobacterium sp.]
MPLPLIRASLTLAVLPLLALACSHPGKQSAPPPQATPSGPPAGRICADPATWPIRDKLAQLLMVGVRDAADARAVVTDHHVGGIFVGSWTDL